MATKNLGRTDFAEVVKRDGILVFSQPGSLPAGVPEADRCQCS